MGNQPIRILQFISSMNRGGPQDFIMSMYRHLDRSKIQFDFILFSPNPSDYEEEIRSLGGNVYTIPKASQAGIVSYLFQLIAILRKRGPYQALHSHMDAASGVMMLIARALGIPARIAQLHDVSHLMYPEITHPLLYRLEAALIRRYASNVIASSPTASRVLQEQLHQPHTMMLHSGIDIERYVQLKQQPSPLRASLGIAEDELVIGHFGRFTAAQNHKFLIDMMEEMIIRHPGTRLVLVGDGVLRAEIQERIALKGLTARVHLLGFETSSKDFLQLIDVLVLPAFREGVPRVLVEAQAAGVPSVVSEALPAQAQIGSGFYARISLDQDVEEWAQWILKAVKSEGSSLECRVKALRKAGFDSRANALFLEAMYTEAEYELIPQSQPCSLST